MFSKEALSEIENLISVKEKIVIVTHYNPDGDAIGSSLGLKHFLRNIGGNHRSQRLPKIPKMDARSQKNNHRRV